MTSEPRLYYRLATPDDWPALYEFTTAHHLAPPDPNVGIAALAEDERGNIHGVWYAQLSMQFQPLVTSQQTGEEGRVVNLRRLLHVLEDGVRSRIPPDTVATYHMFTDARQERNLHALANAGFLVLPETTRVIVGVTIPREEKV